jgi:periplasmic divalent cation tolerance protein
MAMTKTPRASMVFVMTGAEREAEEIARALVDEKLAACANIIGPVRSIYRWHAKVEDAREYLILIKTRPSIYSRVERRIRELHSYEVPEVIALAIANGSRPYLKWIIDNSDSPVTSRRRLAHR